MAYHVIQVLRSSDKYFIILVQFVIAVSLISLSADLSTIANPRSSRFLTFDKRNIVGGTNLKDYLLQKSY